MEHSAGGGGTIVEFCRFAREQGLAGGVQKTLGALRAAACLGVSNREDLKSGLRSVLCSSQDEWEMFDTIFDAFWSETPPRFSPRENPRRRSAEPVARGQNSIRAKAMSGAVAGDAPEEGGSQAVAGASTRESLRQADFSTLRQDDLAALDELSLRLLKQLSRRLSRRRHIATARGRVDLRRTIRSSISRGGDAIDLRYQDRRPRPNRLVILLDISGSMSPYCLFLVRFVYALQNHFKRLDAFLFSTDVVEITHLLEGRRLADALRALSQLAAGWSGGTRIGRSLREFNLLYRRRLRSSDTWFMILSDGWDTGEPEALAAELAAVKRRVHKLIWLNPLLGLADYQPITRGMSAALPYLDVFAPAHNLESLLQLEKYL
ncbi:MAG TPA: VWA domain-containing protein [Terriglobales bacterium]|nr:VWA domain-containing protein [Terriglobales bacterium]